MQIFRTRMCNVTGWCHSRLSAHWLMALVGGGGVWRLREKYVFCVPGNCSVYYLSFVYGRSLWAELNGGENSLHWKANMLTLFSIMTLCSGRSIKAGSHYHTACSKKQLHEKDAWYEKKDRVNRPLHYSLCILLILIDVWGPSSSSNTFSPLLLQVFAISSE